MPVRGEPLGIYVHVPFCGARCLYCDFAIVVREDARSAAWAQAVAAEARAFAAAHGRRAADTIHFGGGTPSRLPPEALAAVLSALSEAFDVQDGAEVALEANPEDVDEERAAAWRALGIGRVTVGVQALAPGGLAAIGRPGTIEEGRAAVRTLHDAGIASLGADFIFGRPGQTLEDWRRELDEILALPLRHLSLYALELDAPTPLVRAIERGRTPRPDPDLAAAMYDHAVERLGEAGFARYEISNFARTGHASRHNLKYWTDAPYVGLGPAAASYVDGARWTNARRLGDYLEGAAPGREAYDADRRAGEAIVFGLRLALGVDLARVAERHGEEPVARRGPALARAAASGQVVREGTRARLAPHAFLVADEVFVDLL